MQQNVGTLDRAGRALLSTGLLYLAWKRQDKIGVIAACSAGIFISSVLSGYCPLYTAIKLNTVGKPI